MFKGNFVQNLPKIYGTYTGGFLVFIILMAIAEQAGVSKETIGILLSFQNKTANYKDTLLYSDNDEKLHIINIRNVVLCDYKSARIKFTHSKPILS